MSIKILCTGDFQLDKSFGTLGKSAPQFRTQLFETFKRVMSDAKNYDLVLVAGDIFDREGTPTAVIEEAADVFTACTTPTVILAGNHDSLKSGIPQVLQAALARRGAVHAVVPLNREPVPLPELGVTIYPSPLKSRGDLSNLYEWIPERNVEQGVRLALMHGALSNIPNGTIPEDVATMKDIDLVICGDQHGPAAGDESASLLFNLEASEQRRLIYSMAPEAQHINQGFVGAYTSVSMSESGVIESIERVEVGEIRFLNSTITIGIEDDPCEVLSQSLSQVSGRPPELTCLRLKLEGEINQEDVERLEIEFARLQSIWPKIEIENRTMIASEGDGDEVTEDDPVLAGLLAQASVLNPDEQVLKQAKELYLINKGRWV